MPQTRPVRALVIDGETPARSELARLLGQDPRVGEVRTATTVNEALHELGVTTIDVVFCDVKTPGVDGRDLVRTLTGLARRTQLLVATAHEAGALLTFELRATDVAGDPEVPRCLEATVRRAVQDVAAAATGAPAPATASHRRARPADTRPARTGVPARPVHAPENGTADPAAAAPESTAPGALDGRGGPHNGAGPAASGDGTGDETIAVELGGVTRFVQRSQVRFVEAHGDYARLHTATGSHLVRIPLTALEQRWADAGFVRIHRSTLVALPHVDEIRTDGGRCAVRLGDRILQVSRRHTKALRDRLVRAATLTRDRGRRGTSD